MSYLSKKKEKRDKTNQIKKSTQKRPELMLAPLRVRYERPLNLSDKRRAIRKRVRRRKLIKKDSSSKPVRTSETDTIEEINVTSVLVKREEEAPEMPPSILEIREVEVRPEEEPPEIVVEGFKFSLTEIFNKFKANFRAAIGEYFISITKIFSKFWGIDYWAKKGVFITSILLLSIVLFGGVSVVGLLQSRQSVGTSGLVIQPPPLPPLPTPTPPEPKIDVALFSDIECTNKKSDIEWGKVEAGKSTSETFCVHNPGEVAVTLSFITENWDPVIASEYMDFTWDYDGTPIEPGSIVEIKCKLKIDQSITGVEKYNFDIVIIASAT